MTHHLVQFNIGRLHHPLDAEENAEFVASLEPINAIAEATPGFVWRLQGEDGQSSSYVDVPEIDDPQLVVNYSIWTDMESLRHFVHKSGHIAYLRRRHDWFEKAEEATTVCWWVPAGEIPSVSEAYKRLLHMREHGPSEEGWPMNKPLPAPGS